jgi:hypothetical protein
MAILATAPLVNARHYRHFAAITLAITLCVAMFASGEARQVVSDQVAQDAESVHLREVEASKFGPRQIGDIRMKRGGHAAFGEDYDPSYGAASASSGSAPDTRVFGNAGPSGAQFAKNNVVKAPNVLSPDEMAKLTAQQQDAYLKRLRSSTGPARPMEEVHDLASIEAGSRARSGNSERD